MDWKEILTSIILLAIGFGIWQIQRTIVKNEKDRAKKEEDHRKYEAALLQSHLTATDVNFTVAEYAKANGCNGNTESALKAARIAKQNLITIVNDQAINNLNC